MFSLARRRAGMPARTVPLLASVVVAALLSSCGATDLPTPRRTVTVMVDAPAPSSASTPAAPSATSSGRPTSAPIPLVAGAHRGAPGSYDEAVSRIGAASAASGVSERFQSPTGNIVCRRGIGAGAGAVAVACEVAKGRVAPPLPSICPTDGPKDIGRIELSAGGARPVCNSDTIRRGGEAKLRYGARTTPSGTTACLSETVGVTCVDSAARHGFFLARDTFVTF